MSRKIKEKTGAAAAALFLCWPENTKTKVSCSHCIPATIASEAFQRVNKRNITTTHISQSLSLCLRARAWACAALNFFSISCFFYSNADSMCLSMRMECFNYSTHRHTSTYDAMCWSKSKPSQTSPNDSQLYICKLTTGKKCHSFHSIRFAFRITWNLRTQ